MYFSSLKVSFVFGIWAIALVTIHAQEVNLTDTEEAEFRQGGMAQLISSGMGGIYGNGGGYQGLNSGSTGAGYSNMIRNLYRPPSFGFSDKVKHWVKSLMNRRQFVKPYYNPTMAGLSYAGGDYASKPMFVSPNGYKAISVPLRQLQKYYKPYYGEGGSSQYLPTAGGSVPGSAASSSFAGFGSSGVGSSNGGLYASESASAGHFTGSGSNIYGSPSDSSALFGTGGSSSSSLFPSGSGSTGGLFSSGSSPTGGLFSSGSSSGSGIFGSQGSSSGIFTASDGASSIYNLPNYGNGGIYGSSGSSSNNFYPGAGANGNNFNLDGASSGIYGGDSSIFGSSNGGYGNSAAASSILSVNSGPSNSNSYSDLYASAANQAASLYNPSSNDNGRGYGSGPGNKAPYGASSSSLYIQSSSGERKEESSFNSNPQNENSFNVGSGRGGQSDASYSVSFKPAQSKSYSASFEGANFQPVSYSSDGNSASFQEKSSS